LGGKQKNIPHKSPKPNIMKVTKTIAILLVIGGLALFFVSIYGYSLGIARHETFGAFQWTGTIVGAVAALYGIFRLTKK
jgi:hypothetical protein